MNAHAVQPRATRRLLARLLDAPHLTEIVQRLEPRRLHLLVRQCGIEECAELLARATTEQLTRVFDEELWTSPRAGAEDVFDADRFALWLEVLGELGPEVAARKLAGMDFDFVTAAVSRLVLVLDEELAIVRSAAAELGSEWEGFDATALFEGALGRNPTHEVGGYTIVARHSESWDAILGVLASLEHDHHPFFGRLMTRCARLSTEYIVDNGGLYDVLTSDEQVIADAAAAREDRREAEGYVTAPQARAFLKLARNLPDATAPAVDPVTASYFREWEARSKAPCDRERPSGMAPAADALEQEVREFLATEDEAAAPRGLLPRRLSSGERERFASLHRQLSALQVNDAAAYTRCTEELAYLANVLVSGCTFQSRSFRPVEAADAALAVCNLGLENGADGRSLVGCFRVGWRLLYEDVSLAVAGRLAEVLSSVARADSSLGRQARDTAALLSKYAKLGEPWRVREDIDVVATLDPPTWAVLVNLLDECPVVPRDFDVDNGGPRLRVSTEFEFISENSQLVSVREFLAALPGALAP